MFASGLQIHYNDSEIVERIENGDKITIKVPDSEFQIHFESAGTKRQGNSDKVLDTCLRTSIIAGLHDCPYCGEKVSMMSKCKKSVPQRYHTVLLN